MGDIQPRPLVVVEDQSHHIDDLLGLLCERSPDLLDHLTVVCLERSGPDTCAAVERWQDEYPEVAVVADVADLDEVEGEYHQLPASAYDSRMSCTREIARLLVPRGLLVQDIQLETLRFVPPDQWCESIFMAGDVQHCFPSRPPQVLFMSNKRTFHATFWRDLSEVGFDPCGVVNKDELGVELLPTLRRRLRESFPFELDLGGECRHWSTGDPEEREQLATELDFVLWEDRAAMITLSGRALCEPLTLRTSTAAAQTWRALVAAHLEGQPGVPTEVVGERVAPEHAGRAEWTNTAAKHVSKLRDRLVRRDMVQTVDHHYRLAEDARVGRVRRRPRPQGPRGGTARS